MKAVKTVCVDFNGVLDMYTGYQGDNFEVMTLPRAGAKEFLAALDDMFDRVVILTCTAEENVWRWLRHYGMEQYVDEVTSKKVPALVYIDDRACLFRGDFEATLRDIKGFRPHWKKERIAPAEESFGRSIRDK